MSKFKKAFALIICFSMLFSLAACKEKEAAVEVNPEPEVIEPTRAELIAQDLITEDNIAITLPEELLAIPDGSSRKFYLENDIDMKGLSWTPKDFKGSFDGKDFVIKNLSISGHSSGIAQVYDGNMKVYDTNFCGMFGILDGANIKNFSLENVSFKCATGTGNIFAGAIAGFMNNSVISNVSMKGKGHLETSSKCFGIGGIAGYGNGLIENCSADMQLVCIDNNAKEKDEQFMGGAYAAGRIDLVGNTIIIDGYDSDHGYVHNGGLVGMYIHYDVDEKGHIDNNSVSGRIKFFEDNRDRRAYCAPYGGEMMSWNLTMDKNTQKFTRDEVFEYNVNLLPEN